ncbi:hypothetical protein M2271_005512 [Streptomyces sp. LBL]|uniref:DUF397 domain-containing protein n=1 Tax=Streptomyces sp. LBL TaxID=2940562 RepID=UPI002473D9B3|nr:DUF397 domain-containing protein [Streptomyces sp. LBL]MDH6627685.1 hypothetical protein [Streptomyces sp. LBL]
MALAQEAVGEDVRWLKSSYSGGSGSDCVEVGFNGPVTSVRDSKAPHRGTLSVPTSAFTAFINSWTAHGDIRETR